MFNRRNKLRISLTVAYALVAFIALNWFYAGDTFCGDAQRPSVALATFRLTLFATALDALAGLLGGLLRRHIEMPWGQAILAALVVGATLYSVQGFLFERYGVSRFSSTAADVSCLLTEGYGMVYPFTIVPAFAFLTFGREMLLGWLNRKESRH
jgi:hypothetical protein